MSRGYVAYLNSEDPELGTVRLCRGCDERWPLDSEFWYFDRTGRVMGRCRACWSERNQARSKANGYRAPFGPMAVAS